MDQARPIIRFSSVSKNYSDRIIFAKADFEIRLGEFVYIVGNTGVGKSSLLKLVYGDIRADEGSVTVDNEDLSNISPRKIPFLRRRLGIVFQDFQLLPDRNVYDNIKFVLQATGWKDKRQIKKKITEVLVNVGMAAKVKAFPHQLSGGEQQRVAIARAMVNDPIILIADEPTGNLDPEASENIMQLLWKINLSGTAILMATHEYRIIRQYPTRVLELSQQRIINHTHSDSFLSRLFSF